MTHTEKLLNSIKPLRNEYEEYYDELVSVYSAYSKFDSESIDEYVRDVFRNSNRAFFTICSKESFNNLSTGDNWIDSIIYTPLNDHSRPFMKKGDIVFCYRQGQFSDLKEALSMRGIYAFGFVASEPKLLFPDKTDHNKYGVAILFPFGMKEHLELRNIQLNPITISLTPYNGNRNDALQYIPENEYSKSLLEQICRKNPYLRKSIENVIGKNIEDKPLPDEIWNINHNLSENSYTPNFSQIIYYGVPGCGKSNKIDKKTGSISDEQKMRVVFHPEYTNADFVGQILPVQTPDGIDYRFKAGPFARILKRALKNPSQPYYLIIEEINRGNAAAIFGDLFQLLDRKSDGWSSYFVENLDLNSFIRSDDDKYSDKNVKTSVQIGSLTFTENTSIRLPPNLSILATMNTSDQNVFILDNAFQRRWDMVLVKNEFGEDSEKAKTEEEQKNIDRQKTALIEGSKITWETFHKTINEKISQFSRENNFSSMIDKRLGCWFVKAVPDDKNDINGKYIIEEKSFKNKILKYLWDDAFKFSREDVFEDADNFESLLEKVKMDAPNFGIFKNIEFFAEKSEKSEEENEV
ncbi:MULTISPECIES: AAA family ATPase [unclassified Treponema]|uniref:AAA family ATPase n=1 Tax=unclassified Treponema TaxID=2638727 RepID=UPI0025EE74EA|nr:MULTISPECIES: AAA family ATPase [unclassified Treponema]